MPIFDFACRACAHEFEKLVRRDATPACPSCGSSDVERRLAMPAVRSETTRGLAMAAAKRRDHAQGRERVNEQRNYELHHDD